MIWYLFLQFFGTNEFELPTLGRVDQACVPSGLSVIFISAPSTTEARNQANRIEQNHLTSELINKEGPECRFENWDLILVTEEGEIKGAYLWEIAEIDRLITEVELYHTIVQRNGTSDSK